MNILLLGSGGREHAFAWKLTQSKKCENLYVAPGNAGTASLAKNINIAATNFEAIKKICLENDIHLLVVGPEDPLVKGISDFFAIDTELQHIPVVGPSKAAAQLEGSKDFAKSFMQRHGIPTAAYKTFSSDDYNLGRDYIRKHSIPIVLKADGLAAGKGVLICSSVEEALIEFDSMINKSKFGNAGARVVVEEYLQGIELSVFVLTDGEHYHILPSAKDYKRIGVGDTGLNTGGMGAISPVPFADELFMSKVENEIIKPTLRGLKQDKLNYNGFIFIGLMNCQGQPKVIEYNCRMGDPETEAVLPRIKNDFVELMHKTATGRLNEINLEIDTDVAATIFLVSGGYPGNFEKGFEITGIEKVNSSQVFHAGTLINEDGQLVTNGGRVIAITSLDKTMEGAISKSLAAAKTIHFDYKYYRTDIGLDLNQLK